MPTWYEVLGTPETAGHDELRRAYRARARLRHPDAHAASSPHDRSGAEAAMQELNAAWSVLGNPESRALYDRRLADDRRRATERARPPQPPRATPIVVPPDDRPAWSSFDGSFDEGADGGWDDGDWVDSGVMSVPRWVHRSIIGVIALVIVGLVVVTAHAGPQPIGTYDRNVEPLSTGVSPVGRCLVIDGPLIGVIDCNGRDTSMIRATVDLSLGAVCPVGTRSVTVPDYPRALCVGGT